MVTNNSETTTIQQNKPIETNNMSKVDINSNKTNNKIEDPKTLPISTYNGDTCDSYNWSQGIHDVTIQIKLPENTGKKNVYL